MARMRGDKFWISSSVGAVCAICGLGSPFIHHALPFEFAFLEVEQQCHFQTRDVQVALSSLTIRGRLCLRFSTLTPHQMWEAFAAVRSLPCNNAAMRSARFVRTW
jgi:hypothetical protein